MGMTTTSTATYIDRSDVVARRVHDGDTVAIILRATGAQLGTVTRTCTEVRPGKFEARYNWTATDLGASGFRATQGLAITSLLAAVSANAAVAAARVEVTTTAPAVRLLRRLYREEHRSMLDAGGGSTFDYHRENALEIRTALVAMGEGHDLAELSEAMCTCTSCNHHRNNS